MIKRCVLIFFSVLLSHLVLSAAETIAFQSGEITLHGELYKPEGTGPFPAVVYNHGSAAGMLSKGAFDVLGPVFASQWMGVFRAVSARSRFECVGWSVHWRSDCGG